MFSGIATHVFSCVGFALRQDIQKGEEHLGFWLCGCAGSCFGPYSLLMLFALFCTICPFAQPFHLQALYILCGAVPPRRDFVFPSLLGSRHGDFGG